MKTFLNDLKNELIKQNVNEEEIEDIIRDHEEMISEAMNEGLKEEDIHLRFGDPKALARELASSTEGEEEQAEVVGFKLWKSITPTDTNINITVSMVSQDVSYQTSKDDQIHIYYEGKDDLKEYQFSYQKGELRFEAPKMRGFLFMRNKKDDMNFLVEIPKHLTIETFKHSSVSADVKYINLNANELQLNTTSGDANLSHAQFDKLKMNTVSGDLYISHVTCSLAETSQVSGDLKLENVIINGLLHAGTVSGDIEINESTVEDAEFSCVSGDVDGKDFYPKTVKFKSVSGDLDIKNSERKDIKLIKTNTLSGEINIQ